MKKFILILLASVHTTLVCGQYHLIGTNYTQGFDHIVNGLPPGWAVYKGATATDPGTLDTLIPTPSSWGASTGFRNYASANNGLAASASTADQAKAIDRALGVRQAGTSGYDPGAAFVFTISNTTGLSDFRLSFKLQSLYESAGRATTWLVDYGIGTAPVVFTPGDITGMLTTGDNTYGSHAVSVQFGRDMDNQPDPVWIRILTTAASTGSGTRTASAIDDFELNWTGRSAGAERPTVIDLFPAAGTMNIPVNTDPAITFNRQIRKGTTGNIYIVNETHPHVDTIPISDPAITVSGYKATINGTVLNAGSAYHINFDSTAFDTAGYTAFGMYHNTDWRFSTAPEVLTVPGLNETFDASCAANELPAGWLRVNKTGSAQWQCHTAYGITAYRITAYSGGKYMENEDWLISPRIDLSSGNNPSLFFRQYKRRAGAEMDILVSADFPGYGDPTPANWTKLPIPMSPADTLHWIQHSAALTDYLSSPFFLAFRYTATDNDGYEVRIDSVVTAEQPSSTELITGIREDNKLWISGIPSRDLVQLHFTLSAAGPCRIRVLDLQGRILHAVSLHGRAGKQDYSMPGLNLPDGLYLIRLEHSVGSGLVKALIR